MSFPYADTQEYLMFSHAFKKGPNNTVLQRYYGTEVWLLCEYLDHGELEKVVNKQCAQPYNPHRQDSTRSEEVPVMGQDQIDFITMCEDYAPDPNDTVSKIGSIMESPLTPDEFQKVQRWLKSYENTHNLSENTDQLNRTLIEKLKSITDFD